jgi:hypothetical protein
MAIQRITEDLFETFTIETNPRRTYVSSSVSGITGSVNLFARRSDIEKEIYPLSQFSASFYVDQNVDDLRKDVINAASSSTDITGSLITYIDAVNQQQASARLDQKLEIYRFTPPFSFNTNTGRKLTTINTVMPYYRAIFPNSNYSYANYHCLNFYTASNVPTSSVLLYPNPIRQGLTAGAVELTEYGFNNAFSFDFWIKPKYTTDLPDAGAQYRPGCLIHLSSSYAISIHTGSSRDINGYPNAFKLLLQLSSSADVVPDLATTSTPYTFFSNDNILPINEWSHVTIKWGGPTYNAGSGSFIVDNVNCGNFKITTSMTVGVTGSGFKPDPLVLCVGNYYQGTNIGDYEMSWFFSQTVSQREGLYQLNSSPTRDYPVSASAAYTFAYPLNAEIHDLKIYDRYLNSNETIALEKDGASLEPNLRFYLPPFFTEESPYRTVLNLEGGIPVTPFFGKDGSTYQPFATDMAFGCGGHYINLENYVRDFATGRYARLWNLTASMLNAAFTGSIVDISANNYLYATGSNIKRLYSILPNDNGKFYPNFNLLTTMSSSTFVDDLGHKVYGYISLRDMISGSYTGDMYSENNAITVASEGGNNPEDYGTIPGDSLAIYNRTKDNTSNQVVFFDISNMFYGNRIKPGTFVLTDTNISGSDGKIGITIKDNGYGNLYRADVIGDHATWASIGNIFYDEGIIVLKMPQLYFFGDKQYEIEFQGIQNIHTLTVNAFANPLELITSSYVAYQTGSIDEVPLANNFDDKYVFISNVLLHDDNLNVIGRTSIAQPVLKRSGQKYRFKIKMDF